MSHRELTKAENHLRTCFRTLERGESMGAGYYLRGGRGWDMYLQEIGKVWEEVLEAFEAVKVERETRIEE